MADKTMNTNLSQKKFVFVIPVVFLAIVTLACDRYAKLQPEDVVKRFWEYSSSGQLNEAAKLTCIEYHCAEPQNPVYSSAKNNKQTSAIDAESNKIVLNSQVREPVLEFPYNAKLIIDWKIVSMEIVEAKTSMYSAQIIVEATSQFKKDLKFVNCLRKIKDTETWKIESINTIDVFDITSDPCLINVNR